MKTLATIAFLLASFVASAQTVFKPPGTNSTQNVNLAWSAPSNAPSAYRLYYGTAADTYTGMLTLTATPSATVSNLLADATWFFRVTAINALGKESKPSNEVRLDAAPAPTAARVVSVSVTIETTTTVPVP